MFHDNSYYRLLHRVGLKGSGSKADIIAVVIAISLCWLPLLLITLFNNSFWTGDITNSFISDFDVQARFLISMPILIMSDRIISYRLGLILNQFTNSGIVGKRIQKPFDDIIQKRMRFLSSKWTDLAVLLLCYLQLFTVYQIESEFTSILAWQVKHVEGQTVLNLAGFWITFISGPFVLFLFYRWLLRIIIWGSILFRISKLKLTLFPVHPDLLGGLGFISYSIRYFSPIALAMSATVAGNMADFMLAEGLHLNDLKFLGLGYFLFITLLFTLPLFSFSRQLIDAREKNIYENYDYTNGIYRELRKKMSKDGFEEVSPEDLKLPDFSAAADLSSVIDRALQMKTIPFTLKDVIPLWIMTAIPFVGVILIEIPVSQVFNQLISLLL